MYMNASILLDQYGIFNRISKATMTQVHPSLESIQFQKTDLFEGIVRCIGKIRKTDHKAAEKLYYQSNEVKELSEVIKKHTGITFEFEDSSGGLAVYVPRLDQTIFDRDVVLNYKKSMIDEFELHYDLKRVLNALGKDVINGTVDLKSSKVTGVFADIKCKMFLPRAYIYWRAASNEELAATILHEIGHVFTSFEYLTRSASTNQALAIMLRVMDQSIGFEDRRIVFSKAKVILKLDDEAYSLIEKEPDPKTVAMVVISNAVKRSKSELGKSVYDLTSCEYLADQFATRHGAGKHLVTFMDKMGVYDNSKSTVDYFGAIWGRVFGLSLLIAIPLGSIAALTASFAIISVIWTTIGLSSVNTQRDLSDEYDNDYSRFSRIKHQMVQRLKESGVSADEKKMLITHIEEIDPIIKKNLSDTNVKLRNKIAMFFSSEHKRDFEYMKLQKDLELIGNNDLYVMSEKLKLI